MSMGRVNQCSQKCLTRITLPTNYRGPRVARRNAIRYPPPTVLEPECKRRNVKNESLQREGFNIQTHIMSTICQSFPNNLQGAIEATQKCHRVCAPTSFIWCRDYLAEMPLLTRTKGRAKILLQKCHVTNALPNQLKGSLCLRSNAICITPRGGQKRRTEMSLRHRPRRIWATRAKQKCQKHAAQ